jgi:hypothetical protein
MPAKSKAQQHLMAAAEHGATFPMAQKVRGSMSMKQLHDFAVGSTKGKPAHVAKASGHPHKNLGKFLHAKKG